MGPQEALTTRFVGGTWTGVSKREVPHNMRLPGRLQERGQPSRRGGRQGNSGGEGDGGVPRYPGDALR